MPAVPAVSSRRKTRSVRIGVRVLPVNRIAQTILLIRGQKVILDADLAAIYGVTTKALNQSVKRNLKRFPADFMFQLTPAEKAEVVTTRDHLSQLKFSPHLPHAFSEHGVAMLSSILSSERAIQMNILIVRAFVKIREIIARNKDLAVRIEKLERGHRDHASIITVLAEEIDGLKRLPPPKSRPIGFTANLDET